MDALIRRPRLPKGKRRIPLNVNLTPEIHRELGRIAGGNRSAAIENLVRQYLADRTRIPEPIT
jgi:metal-responsive CopG/Arc/MetJ family transcriptional regulator